MVSFILFLFLSSKTFAGCVARDADAIRNDYLRLAEKGEIAKSEVKSRIKDAVWAADLVCTSKTSPSNCQGQGLKFGAHKVRFCEWKIIPGEKLSPGDSVLEKMSQPGYRLPRGDSIPFSFPDIKN